MIRNEPTICRNCGACSPMVFDAGTIQLVMLPGYNGLKSYNPLFIHPDDLLELDAVDGQLARIRSRAGAVLAVMEADDTLRRGVVALSHGFGAIGAGYRDEPNGSLEPMSIFSPRWTGWIPSRDYLA